MSPAPRVSILAVDDNQIHSYAIARILRARGFAVCGFLTYPIEPQDLEIVITRALARSARKAPLAVPAPSAASGNLS